jgi:hypothetical protein
LTLEGSISPCGMKWDCHLRRQAFPHQHNGRLGSDVAASDGGDESDRGIEGIRQRADRLGGPQKSSVRVRRDSGAIHTLIG